SSLLFGELADALDLHGFEAGLFQSVGTSITTQLLTNAYHTWAGDTLPNGTAYTMMTGFDPASFFTSMGGAIAGSLGSYVAAKIVLPDSELSANFGAFGSSIGAWLGTFIPIPILGTAIGAFLGQIAGTLIGNAISDDPWADLFLQYDPESGTFFTMHSAGSG